MKKLTGAFLMAISAITIFSFASAEEAQWNKTVLQDNAFWSESYDMKLSGSNCLILVSKDGGRISINTTDYDYYSKIPRQTVSVGSTRSGRISINTNNCYYCDKMIRQTVIIDSLQRRVHIYMQDVTEDGRFVGITAYDKYDIFYVKYLSYAKNLPPEIQAKFDGHWGIK
jgi:hypothetical protein